MCDYAAQYLVYYSVPPAAQSGVDREVPVVARPVAKIVQNIGELATTRPGCLTDWQSVPTDARSDLARPFQCD